MKVNDVHKFVTKGSGRSRSGRGRRGKRSTDTDGEGEGFMDSRGGLRRRDHVQRDGWGKERAESDSAYIYRRNKARRLTK